MAFGKARATRSCVPEVTALKCSQQSLKTRDLPNRQRERSLSCRTAWCVFNSRMTRLSGFRISISRTVGFHGPLTRTAGQAIGANESILLTWKHGSCRKLRSTIGLLGPNCYTVQARLIANLEEHWRSGFPLGEGGNTRTPKALCGTAGRARLGMCTSRSFPRRSARLCGS